MLGVLPATIEHAPLPEGLALLGRGPLLRLGVAAGLASDRPAFRCEALTSRRERWRSVTQKCVDVNVDWQYGHVAA